MQHGTQAFDEPAVEQLGHAIMLWRGGGGGGKTSPRSLLLKESCKNRLLLSSIAAVRSEAASDMHAPLRMCPCRKRLVCVGSLVLGA